LGGIGDRISRFHIAKTDLLRGDGGIRLTGQVLEGQVRVGSAFSIPSPAGTLVARIRKVEAVPALGSASALAILHLLLPDPKWRTRVFDFCSPETELELEDPTDPPAGLLTGS
jgi:hypothetical protein